MHKNYLVHHVITPDGWEPKPKDDKGENELLSVRWMKSFLKWYIQVKKGNIQQDGDALQKHISF